MNNFYTDKQQIIKWLKEKKVKNYMLIPDEKYGFIVDVNDHVKLKNKDLITIPVKFNKVTGSFYCHSNKLISLAFSPQTISGSFYCHDNQLTSLDCCPQTVGGIFRCSNNKDLESIQEINDFEMILLEHKKALITKSFR